MTFTFKRPDTRLQAMLCVFLLSAVSSCSSVPLEQGSSLGSYVGMTASGGSLTKANLRVDSAAALAARTVRIAPTSAESGSGNAFDPKDLALVANAIDRALCVNLTDRFRVVARDEPADLVVHATITRIVSTNKTAAATSTIASLGGAVAFVPVPRLPIGLGGLAIEAEATAQDGTQKAAMLWSRGANMFTTKARYSAVGDAYSLSSAFGADFSRMLVKGKDPFKDKIVMPSINGLNAAIGGDPKYAACKAFGSAPGLTGAVAGQLGLPPGWTDKGASATQ